MRAQDGRFPGDLGGDAVWPLHEVDGGADEQARRGRGDARGGRALRSGLREADAWAAFGSEREGTASARGLRVSWAARWAGVRDGVGGRENGPARGGRRGPRREGAAARGRLVSGPWGKRGE